MIKFRIFKTANISMNIMDLQAGQAYEMNEWENTLIAEFDSLEEAKKALQELHTEVGNLYSYGCLKEHCDVSEYFIEEFNFDYYSQDEYEENVPVGGIWKFSKMKFIVTEDKFNNDKEDIIGINESFNTYKEAYQFSKECDNICNIDIEC